MIAFLHKLRLRLRMIWMVATASLFAPLVAGAALLVVLIGFVRPYGWPERLALGLAVGSLVGVALFAFVQRLPILLVARAADRGLETKDAFGAALQFQDLEGPFGERIRLRAENLSQGAVQKEAAPIPDSWRRWAVAGVLGLAAVGLAFVPNPQDDVRAEQEEIRAIIDDAAEVLEDQAEVLADDPATEVLAEQLQDIAEELRQTDDLATAEELLAEARELLQESKPDDFASRQAAVAGLERNLAENPLAAGGTAEEQLTELAETLDEADPDELEALADRLQDLAETQAAGNPAAAAALGEAAAALEAGDIAGAQAALGEAAQAQADGQEALAAGEATDQAIEAVAAAEGEVKEGTGQGEGEGSGEGQGEGEGEGSGEGQGEGQGEGSGEGQGEGEGSGQGQGEGQGEGQGQGAGSGGHGGGDGAQGEVGGASGGTGSGQGGVGTPGGTDQPRIDPGTQTIVDPLSLNPSDEVDLGGDASGAPGEVVGKGDGPTTAGPVRVPLSEIVDDYATRATATANRDQLAPSQVELVGDYFDLLTR